MLGKEMSGADHRLLPAAAAALRSIAPAGVETGAYRVDHRYEQDLFDVELDAVRNGGSRRRSEFATGRTLLRQLIGLNVAIPVAARGAPVLPDGFAGSLAHDAHLAIGAVSADRRFSAIGLDVEPVAPVDVEFADVVLRADDGTDDALLAFVLKEATYKAWSRPDRPLLEHHDVRLSVSGDRFAADILGGGDQLTGRFVMAATRWIALVVAESTAR